MATVPRPEQSARRILAILLEGGARANEGSLIPQVNMQFITAGGGADDFTAGLRYAADNGWVKDGKNSFILFTESGFEEASADTADFI